MMAKDKHMSLGEKLFIVKKLMITSKQFTLNIFFKIVIQAG